MNSDKEKTKKLDLEQALQKIVFLECICAQNKAESQAAHERERRLQHTLGSSQQREQELHRKLTEYETALEQNAIKIKELSDRLHTHETQGKELETNLRFSNDKLHAQLRELSHQFKRDEGEQDMLTQRYLDVRQRANTLESTNEKLFGKLLALYESLQIQDGTDVDLADFISSMRAEVLSLQHLLKRAHEREAQLAQGSQNHDEGDSDPNRQTGAERETTQAEAGVTESTLNASDEVFEMVIQNVAQEDRLLAQRYYAALQDEKQCVLAAKRLVDLLGQTAAAWILWAIQGCQQPSIQVQLFHCLGQTKDENIFHNITEFYDQAQPKVKLSIIDCCANLVPHGSPDLLKLLQKACQDTNALVRRRALIHLSALDQTESGDLFCSCLNDPDPQVRRLACISLASTTDLDTAQCLIGCLADQDKQVAQSAANAVEQLLGLSAKQLLQLDKANLKRIITRLCAYLSESADRLAPEGRLIGASQLAELIPQHLIGQEMTTENEKALDPSIPESIRTIVQASLGGCSESQLAKELSLENNDLKEVIDEMVQQDQLMRRGSKVFSP